MDFFEQSAHGTLCLFTPEDASERRKRTNSLAREQLQHRLSSELQESLLSPEEESLLFRYYQRKIPETCRYFRFPPAVTATAHWLFSRASLGLSVLQHDPKHLMLTAILLATKLEGLHLTMEQYAAKIPNTDGELLVELEFVLLAALEYKIYFFSPHAALAGLIMDLKVLTADEWDSKWTTEASALLDRICATDALLRYSPARLAAVALLMVLSEGRHRDALRDRLVPLARMRSSSLTESLEDTVQEVKSLLEGYSAIDAETVKAIDRRLLQLRKALAT